MHAHDRVLLFGHHPTLLQTRCLVLEKAGFQVSVAQDLATAAEKIAIHPIDCVVLCQTLSADERKQVMTMAKALRQEKKILVIQGEFTALPANTKAVLLQTAVHPAALIAAVTTIARGKRSHALKA